MSGPADPELCRRFLNEAFNSEYPIDHIANDLLFISWVLIDGGWWMGNVSLTSSETSEFLNRLACRPLLEPYRSNAPWSHEQINALKVKHRLTS